MRPAAAIIPLVGGVLFGIGVCLAGMVRPSKIVAALDLGGAWDPSLYLVMIGALTIHAIAWRIIKRSRAPRFGSSYPGKPSPVLDLRLVGGAAVFGVGWGLAGYCPGPVVVSLVTGTVGPFVFVVTMLAGMALVSAMDRKRS